jgi:type I restriction enzyme S subunit
MNWPVVTLGSIADVNWGDTSVTKDSYVPSGFPAYSATGNDGFLPYADFDKSAIVLSAIGARCGKTWFATGKWSCIKNTIRFWSTNPSVDDRYLYWATANPNFWPRRGAAQPFITIGDARQTKVHLPPLDQQRRIAAILDSADVLRIKRRATITKFKSLPRSLFVEMFGEPKTNPKKWQLRALGDVTEFFAGSALPKGIDFAGQPGLHPVRLTPA